MHVTSALNLTSVIMASPAEDHLEGLRLVATPHLSQPEIMVTDFAHESYLAPLIEHEGEAYLERIGGVRRHTVANVHSDIQLLSMKNRMCSEREEVSGAARMTKTASKRTAKTFCNEPAFFDSRPGGVEILRGQSTAEMKCGLTS